MHYHGHGPLENRHFLFLLLLLLLFLLLLLLLPSESVALSPSQLEHWPLCPVRQGLGARGEDKRDEVRTLAALAAALAC